jgi:hypothetical protein
MPLDTQPPAKVSREAAPENQPIPAAPEINRVSNATLARAMATVACLTGLSACEGEVTAIKNGCSPVPNCPAVELNAQGPGNFYASSHRDRRVNPETHEIIRVCEPAVRDFCTGDRTPAQDHCELPVCANAVACDPIPSRSSNTESYRDIDVANFPINNDNVGSQWDYLDSAMFYDIYNFPVIFDNTPDCKLGQGEKPVEGASYLTCDPLPTCDSTIAYCDPTPRCKPGESPIFCTGNGLKFGPEQEYFCQEALAQTDYIFSMSGIDVTPLYETACLPETDPDSGLIFYTIPSITKTCLPIPECQTGEVPYNTNIVVPVVCGQLNWISDSGPYTASCDRIKSCK